MNSKLLAAGIVIWHALIPVRLYIYARVGAFLWGEYLMTVDPVAAFSTAIIFIVFMAIFYKALAHKVNFVDLPFT